MSALETKSLLCVWLNRNIICRDGGRGGLMIGSSRIILTTKFSDIY